jgi:hypothetical protein
LKLDYPDDFGHMKLNMTPVLALCIIGIFDLKISLFRGERVVNANTRLLKLVDRRGIRTHDLRLTDPR